MHAILIATLALTAPYYDSSIFGDEPINSCLPLTGGALSGALTSTSGVTLTGSASQCSGDGVVFDQNGVLGCTRSTDAAPDATTVKAQNAYPAAATNKTGANLNLAAGSPTMTIVIDNYAVCGTDTITFTIDGTATVKTEGTHWTAATSNAVTCGNVASMIESAFPGLDAVCSTATVQITLDPSESVINRVTLAESDANCTTVSTNTSGVILAWHDLATGVTGNKFCMEADCSTYIYASADNVPALVANNVTRFSYPNGATRVEGASFIQETPARATPGGATASTTWQYVESQNSIISQCIKVGSGTPLCFQVAQNVVDNVCTAGQLTIDTGGATVEICYCSAANTWKCGSLTSANPAD